MSKPNYKVQAKKYAHDKMPAQFDDTFFLCRHSICILFNNFFFSTSLGHFDLSNQIQLPLSGNILSFSICHDFIYEIHCPNGCRFAMTFSQYVNMSHIESVRLIRLWIELIGVKNFTLIQTKNRIQPDR